MPESFPIWLCVGEKALANGFPISGCIGTPAVMQAWPESDGEALHTSTFFGKPARLRDGAGGDARALSKRLGPTGGRALGDAWKRELISTLGDDPRVAEKIRGIGLMIGIEFVKDRDSLAPDAAPDIPGWS